MPAALKYSSLYTMIGTRYEKTDRIPFFKLISAHLVALELQFVVLV